MKQYVEVAVNVPQVSGLYHYHLPPDLEGKVAPGSLVVVPFGRQTVQGVALRLIEEPQVAETKAVQELVDPQPVLSPAQLELAAWLAENTLAPLAACLDMMVPPGLSQVADLLVQHIPSLPGTPSPLRVSRSVTGVPKRYGGSETSDPRQGSETSDPRQGSETSDPRQGSETSQVEKGTAGLPPLAAALLARLEQRGSLRGRQLEAAFPRQNWHAAVEALKRRGLVQARSALPPTTARPKTVRTVQITCPPEAIDAFLNNLSPRPEVAARREAVLRFLASEPYPVDVAWVYAQTGSKAGDLDRLLELGLVALGESEIWRDPLEKIDASPYEVPILTGAQQGVFAEINAAIQASARGQSQAPFLLHGVTGSGKTEIYLQAVAAVLAQGRQAIILVPEISLTPQTLRRFMGRFPGQVGVVHSKLSDGERYDTWRRARAGLLPVVVGPRSALFTPMPCLGLIVVDECHDESYYQSDLLPCYHAVTAAVAYARLAGAVVVFGSATPDIVQTYLAGQNRWRSLALPYRILAHRQAVAQQAARLGIAVPPLGSDGQAAALELPAVQMVDMRQELKSGNRTIFSRPLQAALAQVLKNEQQAILFLNRRGTATYVFCRDCGQALRCPRCDRPLTYHNPISALTCHACGYERKKPDKCPHCASPQIREFGAGTERVESELQNLFPQARCLRWDFESTRQKGAHELIMTHFAAHRADILIGTQMLAKGLDLPLVTLVGVVLAETGLNLPDYRASERTFQVLTQVAGRAGRSLLGGRVILQTYQPEHYAIQAAARHDYAGFYQQELEYRRRIGYPPFAHLVRLEYRHKLAEQAQAAAREMAQRLQNWIAAGERSATELIGPAPCFFTRENGMYRWQIVLRGPDPASLLHRRPLGEWRVEVDPPSLL